MKKEIGFRSLKMYAKQTANSKAKRRLGFRSLSANSRKQLGFRNFSSRNGFVIVSLIRDICTRTDSVTVFGLSSYMTHCSKARNAKKKPDAIPSFSVLTNGIKSYSVGNKWQSRRLFAVASKQLPFINRKPEDADHGGPAVLHDDLNCRQQGVSISVSPLRKNPIISFEHDLNSERAAQQSDVVILLLSSSFSILILNVGLSDNGMSLADIAMVAIRISRKKTIVWRAMMELRVVAWDRQSGLGWMGIGKWVLVGL